MRPRWLKVDPHRARINDEFTSWCELRCIEVADSAEKASKVKHHAQLFLSSCWRTAWLTFNHRRSSGGEKCLDAVQEAKNSLLSVFGVSLVQLVFGRNPVSSSGSQISAACLGWQCSRGSSSIRTAAAVAAARGCGGSGVDDDERPYVVVAKLCCNVFGAHLKRSHHTKSSALCVVSPAITWRTFDAVRRHRRPSLAYEHNSPWTVFGGVSAIFS